MLKNPDPQKNAGVVVEPHALNFTAYHVVRSLHNNIENVLGITARKLERCSEGVKCLMLSVYIYIYTCTIQS